MGIRRSDGPSLLDVRALQGAMGLLHRVTVIIELRVPDGSCAYTQLVAVAVSHVRSNRYTGRSDEMRVGVRYPNRNSATLEGAMFKLLHELDSLLSVENWAQAKF